MAVETSVTARTIEGFSVVGGRCWKLPPAMAAEMPQRLFIHALF
jgi:hypothetical protein